MLVTKTNPTGVDSLIEELQKRLFNGLIERWNIPQSQYECYGRCYKNRKDEGFVAELYLGEKEYKDAYWDDSLSVVSFFGEGDRSENQKGNLFSDVHLIVFVNLEKVKPSITHRADAEVRADVISFIQGATFQGVELGLDNVLREYPGSRKALNYTVEMQPVHCFRLNLKISYDPLRCIGRGF